ncbi:MAG: DUF3443 family protein [Candidatus Binataceae bacterium]
MTTLAIFAARGPSRCLAAGRPATGAPGTAPNTEAAPAVQPNVMKANVWAGMYGNYFNGPFTSVTICQTGTTSCEKIGGILIDTGSFGLRIFGQVNHLKLPAQTTSNGKAIAECVPFGTLSTWGRVANVDVKLGGEPTIPNLPIQIINPNYSVMPAACRNGPPLAQSPAQLGFNGILGVGLFGADCGDACATLGPQNPSIYYQCSSGGCTVAPVADSNQVQNPVPLLPGDNNGVVLKMPAIPFLGASRVSGKLVLGINTRRNNQLNGAFVYKTDDAGNIATTYNNATMDGFIDSGSNALFFDNGSIPQCDPSLAPGFYCPSSLLVLGAINTGRLGSASGMVSFNVANALSLAATGNKAFYNVAGTFGGKFFDFGLPFFFGRNVYTGIDGQATSGAGAGPFFAY